jgi:hypothetical protein
MPRYEGPVQKYCVGQIVAEYYFRERGRGTNA